MQGKFICHRDFAALRPLDVFHKETEERPLPDVGEKYRNRHILFRRKFRLDTCGTAFIDITADDYFKLYINGTFVMQGPPPSYPNAYGYMRADVGRFLRRGENVIAVHTYYQGLVNRVWVSGDLRESFFCELTADGVPVLVSDEQWKCADHTAYSDCGRIGYDTAFAERYDSRAPEVGFERTDYDDTAWENANIYENADYRPVKSEIRPLDVYSVRPVTAEQRGDVYFADFGREYVGQVYAKARGRAGDEIVLRYGEELNDDGTVRYDMRCNCLYEERWILSGGDDELSQYDYKGFRYLEMHMPPGVRPDDVQMVVRHYPFENKAVSTVHGNEVFENIWNLCVDTVHYGTQEVFVDCPTREKGQYLGDMFISGRAQAVLTGDTAMVKKAVTDFCRSDFICKGLMAVSTASFMQEIADSSLLLPSIVLWIYRFDGDRDFLGRMYPYVKGVFSYFCEYENTDGLLDGVTEKWNLVDWPANLRDGYDFPLEKPIGPGVHNVINAHWIGFLKAYDEIAKEMGDAPTGKAGKSEDAYIKAFFNEKTGLFCDCAAKTHAALHSNVLPLYYGIKHDDETFVRRAIDFLMEKKLTSMGVYMSYFALTALMERGEKEKAVRLVTDDGAWAHMLAQGATTTFEAWGKEQKWNTSLFHPWATAPIIVFAEYKQR